MSFCGHFLLFFQSYLSMQANGNGFTCEMQYLLKIQYTTHRITIVEQMNIAHTLVIMLQ